MLSNNASATFSGEESDFLHFPERSGLNFNAHSMHSLMEDFIKQLVHSVYKKISRANIY